MKRKIPAIVIITLLILLLFAIFWFIAPEMQVMLQERLASTTQALTSSDKLNFAGVILSTIITITVLCVTILFTQKQQLETMRLSKLPYIVSDMQVLHSYDEVKIACDVMPHRFYFLLPLFGYCVSRNYFEAKQIYNLLEEIIKDEENFFEHHLIIDYQLTNSGAGNAVNYRLLMNTMELSKVTDVLAVNQNANYLIVIHDSNLKLCDNIKFSSLPLRFEISYMDESSVGCYSQVETIGAERNNELAYMYTVQEPYESLSNARRMKSKIVS